jgi:hypothetical protein
VQDVDSSLPITDCPTLDSVLKLICIKNLINIVLHKRLCQSRATAIPDNALWLDAWNE